MFYVVRKWGRFLVGILWGREVLVREFKELDFVNYYESELGSKFFLDEFWDDCIFVRELELEDSVKLRGIMG